MTIVQPTLEHLLDRLDEVYIRIEEKQGVRSLVAGGLNKQGIWLEFPTHLDGTPTLLSIVRCLELMICFIEEEQKGWSMEQPYHKLFRDFPLTQN